MSLSPVTAEVECADQSHRLGWRDGVLTALDHPDPERERALTALGGGSYRCLQLIELWQRHRDDLDVLMLASRGSSDRLRSAGNDERHHGVFVSHGARAGNVTYSGAYRAGRFSSMTSMSVGGGHPRPPELLDVFSLDGALPDRLVADVLEVWTQRFADGDDRVVATRPRLVAALYGRFAAACRDWSGERALPIELTMADDAPSITRNGSRLEVRLPFGWLSDVWLPGWTVTADRFVLSAREPRDGRTELTVVDRDLRPGLVAVDVV